MPHSIFRQIPHITGWMSCVGNLIIAVLYHIVVGSDDSGSFRDCLHPRRVERAIEVGRCWDRTVVRMIRKWQYEHHLREHL